jgi:hypothetical protein
MDVTVVYRHSTKVGDDYISVELGITTPEGAAEAEILTALETGELAFQIVRQHVEGKIADIRAQAPDPNGVTPGQESFIGDLLAALGVPDEAHDEALEWLGGAPQTKRAASELINRLIAFRDGETVPDGWPWSNGRNGKPEENSVRDRFLELGKAMGWDEQTAKAKAGRKAYLLTGGEGAGSIPWEQIDEDTFCRMVELLESKVNGEEG